MKQRKNLGIWMDHTSAHLIEYTSDGVQNQELNNDLSHQDMQAHLQQAEHTAHNKEQQQQANFYNKIADVMEQYQHVLLFGPTDAKKELMNVLKDNHKFENIHMVAETTDKMTTPQMNAYVLDYFKKH